MKKYQNPFAPGITAGIIVFIAGSLLEWSANTTLGVWLLICAAAIVFDNND